MWAVDKISDCSYCISFMHPPIHFQTKLISRAASHSNTHMISYISYHSLHHVNRMRTFHVNSRSICNSLSNRTFPPQYQMCVACSFSIFLLHFVSQFCVSVGLHSLFRTANREVFVFTRRAFRSLFMVRSAAPFLR